MSTQSQERLSNIELLRIVAMLLIVAAHYAVNSTVMWKLFDPIHPTPKSVFMHLWGMWGKMAINVFVLITGYFMCGGRLTVRRYMKLLLEILFYSWIMWLILAACGYDPLTLKEAANRLLRLTLFTGQNKGFVSAFMWMYLTIPFLNVYIKAADKHNLYYCIAVMLCLFSVCGTILNASVYHHVFWYMTLYLVGAAIRLYPFKWMNNNRFCIPVLGFSVILAWISVVGIDLTAMWLGHAIRDPYFYVRDSHKILAFVVGLFMFLTFKNLRIPQSRLINTVASTTFGVLLIHAASDGMRRWLWGDFINVPHAYLTFSLPKLVVFSIISTVGVFAVCSGIDYLRIRFVERPIMKAWR